MGLCRTIIDCDPGHDDAVALALALASPEDIDVMGITTSAGNAPAVLTQKNALMICEFVGRTDIPVYAGCDRPIMRAAQHADVHGRTGIDGFASFEPRLRGQSKHAVDYIIETLLAADDDSITLTCLAPLTNLAMAIVREPRILPKIASVLLMGGARSSGGNITPAATFNIFFDPQAAHIVFTCGRPLVVISLDATIQVLSSAKRLQVLRDTKRPVATALADMMARYDEVRRKKFGFDMDGAPVNDPCVVAYLIDPGLFTSKFVNIEIETQSERTMGMTVVDFWGITGRTPNANWVHGADAQGIFDLMTDRLRRL